MQIFGFSNGPQAPINFNFERFLPALGCSHFSFGEGVSSALWIGIWMAFNFLLDYLQLVCELEM
jgi:hypothetical protein